LDPGLVAGDEPLDRWARAAADEPDRARTGLAGRGHADQVGALLVGEDQVGEVGCGDRVAVDDREAGLRAFLGRPGEWPVGRGGAGVRVPDRDHRVVAGPAQQGQPLELVLFALVGPGGQRPDARDRTELLVGAVEPGQRLVVEAVVAGATGRVREPD